jgi:hypothetical protein
MLASYKRKSNIAGAIFLAGIVGDVILLSTGHKDLWNNSVFATTFGITWAASYLYALWAYVKAKGRSDAWVLMAFLNVIGLIVLLMLKDLHKEDAASAAHQGT